MARASRVGRHQPSRYHSKMMGKRPAAAAAALLAAAAVLVALAFYPRDAFETETPPLAVDPEPLVDDGKVRLRYVEESEPAEPVEEAEPAEEASGEDYAATPCEGCLDERAALDVAEAYLSYVKPNHLGLRLQLYSDIPGDPTKQRLPMLPPGLEGAPAHYSVSDMILPPVEDPEETWVVWVQVGWLNHEGLEARIEVRDFPPIARSWPPLKFEKYILVDARTGAVKPTGIYDLRWELSKTRRDHPVDVFGEMAERAAQERAEHWLGKSRTQEANLGGLTGTPPLRN